MTTDRRRSGQGLAAPFRPIAVIGMACRLPGAADLESFWAMQRNGVDGITEIPPERWNADRYYDPYLSEPGKMNTRWGGFLSGLAEFDADFFGISPAEATTMDPQHRLLLETAWHAVEDAALAPDTMHGSAGGVFIGISGSEFGRAAMGRLSLVNAYTAMGNAPSLAVNRLSQCFGLTGQSMGVDTGCSSSLVAVHLACGSLNAGESSLALAGGVNAVLAPDTGVALSHAWMMAADGRCKSFDAAADGYTRAEGCGVVVLKRLDDALSDGDPIRAVIIGTAVAHGGADPSSWEGQRAVAEAALAAANLTVEEIGYIEAHGVGTPLADREELLALQSLMAARKNRGTCLVGSIKTNIGHLEAAAGVAALIRTVQVLEHRLIPPLLHLNNPSPAIDWGSGQLALAREATPWSGKTRRIAGVNSFGLGGTNAHVLVAEAPALAPGTAGPSPGVLVLSAKSPEALRVLASRFAEFLRVHPDTNLADVCHTAATGRARFKHCISLHAADLAEMVEALDRFCETGEGRPGAPCGVSSGRRISLPGYPFESKHYWPHPHEGWPKLHRISSPALSDAIVFETTLEADMPCIGGHRVHGIPVASGPVLAWLIQEAAEIAGTARGIAGLEFLRPLLFDSASSYVVQFTFDRQDREGTTCRVYSRDPSDGERWIMHARALCTSVREPEVLTLAAQRHSPTDALSGEEFYASCREAGIDLSPDVRISAEFHRSPAGCLGRLRSAKGKSAGGRGLGAVLQAAVELLAAASGRPADAPWVPLSAEIAQMLSGAAPVWGYATVEGASHAQLFGHVYFWDATEKPAAEVHGLRLRTAPRGAFVPASPRTGSLSSAPHVDRWAQTLREADPQLREQLLAAFLREQIASLLGTQAAFDSPDRTGFFESGIDSLMLIELRNRLQRALGSTLEIPMAVLFNYSTPEALAHYLLGEISSGPTSGAQDALAVEVAGLSEEALDRSLEAFDEWSQAEKV